MESFLEFEHVSKSFGPVRAVEDVSCVVKRGEFFSLLGPSGCGKTTLLRLMAGFEQPDSGRIMLDGQDITRLPPNRRNVNTVFQNYALFPHLSVHDNIAFGPRIAGWPRSRVDDEVARLLALIQMEDQAHKKPHQISGGQKQRVAIARALINKPRVLLLDEPLAALDLKLRQRMLLELDLIHDQVGITFLYVTHDQTEAMSLSDRIAVMHRGRVEQVGTPTEMYEAPQTSFVAAFIGDTNFFNGQVDSVVSEDYCRLNLEGLGCFLGFNDRQKKAGDRVHLSLRPEKFRIAAEPPDVSPDRLERPDLINRVQGVVEDIIYSGNHTKYWVRAGSHRIAVFQQHRRYHLDEKPIRWGDTVWIWWYADTGYMLGSYDPSDVNLVQAPAANGTAGSEPGAGNGKGAA